MMKLPKTAKPIKDARHTWIDTNGDVYTLITNGTGKPIKRLIKKHVYINKRTGYKYIGIKYKDMYKTKRLHRLVAETFIDNTNNYPYVGHKNNIKTDNRVENLYWTTPNENTKKAYIDDLAKNKKGFDNDLSKPVKMYETSTNKLLGVYGSITEAAKQTGHSKTTISRQSKYHRPVRKPFYFRYLDDETSQ